MIRAAVELTQLVVKAGVARVEIDSLLQLGDGFGDGSNRCEGACQLLVAPLVVGGDLCGLLEGRQSFGAAILGDEERAVVKEGLLAGVGIVLLPGDGGEVGVEGISAAVLGLVGEAEIVLGFDGAGGDGEDVVEGLLGADVVAVRHLGAAEVVPEVGIGGDDLKGLLEPIGSLLVVAEKDVVEGDDFEIFGAGRF